MKMPAPWGKLGSWRVGRRVNRDFSPLQLTALRAWYKSDVGITIATGVSQWDDQSGNGNHLVQAATVSQPVVTAAAINGLPAITFDGANSFMQIAFTLPQPVTLFMLLRAVTWSINDNFCDGAAISDTMLIQQVTASPQIRMFGGASLGNNSDLAVNTFGLITAIFNGVSSELQINNNTALSGDAGTASPAGLTLGSRRTGTLASNIGVAEVIVINAVATAAERAKVRAYSQARYGVGA